MSARTLPAPLDQLVRAVNAHDLSTLVGCFDRGYVNRTPAHPAREFVGRDQVRRNWAHLFAAVPDMQADVLRCTVDGPTVWSEWALQGSKPDASPFLMRGVLIFEVPDAAIASATVYLEPVEHLTGAADHAVRRATGGRPPPQEQS